MAEGIFLSDRNMLLAQLRRTYAEGDRIVNGRELARHLAEKGKAHLERAFAAFNEALCQLQLAGMAAGQASIFSAIEELTSAEVRGSCQWKGLADMLCKAGMATERLSLFDGIINGHKHLRLQNAEYPGREIVVSIGELEAVLLHLDSLVAA